MGYQDMTVDFFDSVARDRKGFARVVNCAVRDNVAETERQKPAILRMLPENDWSALRVLDMGCGVGRLTRWFAGVCKAATGVDWSPEMLSAAEAECAGSGAKFVQGNIGDRALAGKLQGRRKNPPFDLTFQWCVFIHLTDDERWKAAVANMRALSGRYVLYCDKVNRNKGQVPYVRVRDMDAIVSEVTADGEYALVGHSMHTSPPEDDFALLLFQRC